MSTPATAVEASNSGRTDIFNDLGSGTVLGSRSVSAADNNDIISIPLNSAAVNLLNASRGGQFALGGAITTLAGSSAQYIFAYTGDQVAQLVLTFETGDWYKFTVPANEPLVLQTSTPADGPGEFANTLAPQIELYDPSGNLVASGTTGADGHNQSISYNATAAGVYRVRVSGNSASNGEYFLSLGHPLTVTIPSDATEGDGTVMGMVSVPVPLDHDLVVNLTSSDADRATVPASVTIPAGQTGALLPITIIDNSLLDGLQAVTIAATADDYLPGNGTIKVHDNETATLTLNLPANVHESDGTVLGTVVASRAPSRDITVQLLSTAPGRLSVPATVTIPAGQTTADFPLTVFDDHVIQTAPTPVTVVAQVEHWSYGMATVNVIDDDRTITVTLPTDGWEGQVLSGAGTVQLAGITMTNLVISLASADTSELSVPATVTVLAGRDTATFDLTLVSNHRCEGPQNVSVAATATGFIAGSDSMLVRDSDVYHFVFDTIGSPQTAGVPFVVTASAYDIDDNLITVYDSTAALSGAGSGGPLSISPVSATFAGGLWTGSVTVNAVDPAVTLTIDGGAGAVGTSNSFAVQPGPVASFQWSTIASPQKQETPFPVTLTALDANGYTVSNFDDTATLSGVVRGTATESILGQPDPTWSGGGIGYDDTLGYSFTPSSDILVTDVLHYFGSKVSIWTDSGVLIASQTFDPAPPGWVSTPLATPIELYAGTTYRIGALHPRPDLLLRHQRVPHFSAGNHRDEL